MTIEGVFWLLIGGFLVLYPCRAECEVERKYALIWAGLVTLLVLAGAVRLYVHFYC